MATETKIGVKPILADFLRDQYEVERARVRREERRNYSQNEYAKSIGLTPQTMSRLINGELGMTMDTAVILLKFYGPDILDCFEYGDVLDYDSAVILAKLPRLSPERKASVIDFLQDDNDENDRAPGVDNQGALQTI